MPRHVKLLLGALLAAALVYVPLDWSRLITGVYPMSLGANALKLCSSLLATIIAWTIGEQMLDATDRRRFAVMFALSLVADACFVFGVPPLGILLFMVFQTLLCRRNLTGWTAAWTSGQIPRGRLALMALGAALVVLGYLGWLLPKVTDPVLKVGVPVYAGFIYCSLLAAIATRWIGHFPAANNLRMALGGVLFFCCDLTVGGNLVLPPDSRVQVFSSSLTWMFYAPALALIATSGYRTGADVSGH